jgi:hypothetical protein
VKLSTCFHFCLSHAGFEASIACVPERLDDIPHAYFFVGISEDCFVIIAEDMFDTVCSIVWFLFYFIS